MGKDMPFLDRVASREEACRLASVMGVNRRALCARLGISPTTLYKWLGRYAQAGAGGLSERSRRPLRSPGRCGAEVETAVLAVRALNPVWGGRKIASSLARSGAAAPAASTVTAILRRNGVAMTTPGQAPWRRFVMEAPNRLWQMDFKGHVAAGAGRLHPLTVIDDHSRYAVVLAAAGDERTGTVAGALTAAFERYGLPEAIQTDNGSPWGDDARSRLTRLGVWLIEHGVTPWHTAPFHPQSNGKNERFNRTLKAEVLNGTVFGDLAAAQAAFDGWRRRYNHERPHEALAMAAPAERYAPSPRAFNPVVAPHDYAAGDIVRQVDAAAWITIQGRRLKASKALIGKRVALRPTDTDGVYDLMFRNVRVKTFTISELAAS
jgi:transposase InsO family protein